MSVLREVYGDLLIVRPPVPATTNKAGANYKSEVTHLDYSPRRAYDEWLQILDAIVACGGDALYQFEAADDLEAPVESPVSGEDQEEGLLPLEYPEELLDGEAFQEGDGRAWYVVHCYSGYENKVRHNLEQRIETMGMKDKIFDIVVPTEEEIEVREGKRRTVERRVFPGYILVNMILSEESWYVVRNTPGVTGFVGMGNNPMVGASVSVAVAISLASKK